MTSGFESLPHKTNTGDRREEQALETLKTLLLGEEQDQIEELQGRLDNPVTHAEEVAVILPQALRRSKEEDLTRALERPMAQSILRAVRRDPKSFADALFPIMGPAIRRAISETLKGLVQNLNRTLDYSLSPRGFRWRIESWRTGVQFAEIVMRRTLAYRVEQAFLIRPRDGLLVQHVSDLMAVGKDADAVSAMLTAIQSFVGDAFDATEPLESMDMEEHTVWLLHGPQAYLACVIRGLPPRELHDELGDILADIHGRHGELLESYSGDRDAVEIIKPDLEKCLVAKQKASDKSGFGLSLPLLLVLLAGLAGIGWIAYEHWRESRILQEEQARQTRAVAVLAETPGIVMTDIEAAPGRLRIRGLRDPLSADPRDLFAESGLQIEGLETDWRPYQAPERDIALRRARQRLAPPATAQLDLDEQGRLTAAGSATGDWIAQAKILAYTVPGVTAADFAAMVTPDQLLLTSARARLRPPSTVQLAAGNGLLTITGDAPARWIDAITERLAGTPNLDGVNTANLIAHELQTLAELRESIESVHLWFAQGSSDLNDTSVANLVNLAALIGKLNTAVSALNRRTTVTLIGRTDGIGALTRNERIARDRAEQVRQGLAGLGVPDEMLRTEAVPLPTVDEPFSPKLRRVEFRVSLSPALTPSQTR